MGANFSKRNESLGNEDGPTVSLFENNNNRTASKTDKRNRPKTPKTTRLSRTTLGRHEKSLLSREINTDNRPNRSMTKPKVESGQLYEDEAFPRVVNEGSRWRRSTKEPSWKRPKEFSQENKEIRLFGDKVNRYSVRQGQIGDCYFLTALSAIADHQKCLKQVLPKNAYRTKGRKYRGIFHCRFWWMGEWIDVYTDDRLPYNDEAQTVFGGKSKEKNVVWVSLLEKALAKLCKGYGSVGGDQSAAYMLLTGGIVEELNVNETQIENDQLFKRIRRVIKSGSAALTGIDESKKQHPLLQGLVPNHAYQITATTKVKRGEEKYHLLKIRNPWGEKSDWLPDNENGEWKGRWSNMSDEWKDVNKRFQNKHNVKYGDDGEFWICMEDFRRLFGHIYFADTIPNFDEKGFKKKDRLNKVINIFGKWEGETAAGNDFKQKFKNPSYILTISSKGPSRDNRVSVVLQLIQQYENVTSQVKEGPNQLFCRLDLCRIEKKKMVNDQFHVSLTELTNPEDYVSGRFITYRYKLLPGKYLLIPNYLSQNQRFSRTFCIRAFATTSMNCRQVIHNVVAMTGKSAPQLENPNTSPANQVYSVNVFGEWNTTTSDGSDEVRRMKNQKFILTVPGLGDDTSKISFQLRHSRDKDRDPHCRLDVFKIIADRKQNKNRWIVLHQITKDETFVGGAEVSYEYDLSSGQYLLLANCSKTQTYSCAFSVRVVSSRRIQCRQITDQAVVFVQKAKSVFEQQNQKHKLGRSLVSFGEWVLNKTAGGQIRYETFDRNPQYELTVSGNTCQPLLIDLLQETIEPICPIGYHVYQVAKKQKIPADKETLLGSKTKKMTTSSGETRTLCQTTESSDYFLLDPGRYIVLVYADKPTNVKKFTLVIYSQRNSRINLNKPK